MGFLGFLEGSPIKKLEKEAEANPSPQAFSALAQKHIELEELDQALRAAEKGLQTFRDSSQLKDIVFFVKKLRSHDRIKRLRDEIRVQPSSGVYTQLADIYRELWEIDQALELLQECTGKFPDDEVAFRLIGQIRLENFLQEVIAYDGLHAWHALVKAKSLHPTNTTIRMLLSQFYYAIGANALCVVELREELEENQTALDIKDFLADLGTPGELPPGATVETLIERCEEAGALTNSLRGFPRVNPGLALRTSAPPKVEPAVAQKMIQSLAGVIGLRNALILDRDNKVVASLEGENAVTRDSFQDLVVQISEVSGEACRRMDIGSFVVGGLQLPEGGAAIHRRRGMTFALLFGDPMKQDRAALQLADLVNRTVGGGGGNA